MPPPLPESIPATLQELPPKWAHFCLGVESFLVNELGVDMEGKAFLTAFSGGIDSTALLLVLKYISRRNHGHVFALHLDHGLRAESPDEAAAAVALCKAADIPCTAIRRDVQAEALSMGMGIEEAGRYVRYALLERERERLGAQHIALGHHLDDLCEDVLMRMLRGAGWPGLSGMPGIDPDRHLVRPFLLTPKNTLRDFLHDLHIPWSQDDSNTDQRWKRNRIRHSILPLFVKENQSFPASVARMWRMGRLDDDFWFRRCQTLQPGPLLAQHALEGAHQAERMRFYKHKLDAMGPGQALADSLFRLDAAWREQRIGAVIQFPGDKTAKIVSEGVVFRVKH